VLQVPSEYPTIQAALDAAPPGAMVKVAGGIFHEHVQLREDVDLVGSGWRKTVIDAGGAGDVVSANGVHKFLLKGLALRGSGPGGRGLFVNGATSFTFGVTARVEFCRITDNGYGIQVSNVHSGILEIRKNVIDRNDLDAVDPFIGTTILERNTIVGNGGSGFRATDGGGQNFLSSNAPSTAGTACTAPSARRSPRATTTSSATCSAITCRSPRGRRWPSSRCRAPPSSRPTRASTRSRTATTRSWRARR
jgi:hypothetical protein